MTQDTGRELLTKVLDYYEGRKPYDFHRLFNSEQRSNEAFDAWQEIAGEIRTFLGREKTKRRKKAKEAVQ